MASTARRDPGVRIPDDANAATVRAGEHDVALTNLQKVFFPETGLTKGALLQYYADVAPLLLPHIARRAMVMKRYPNGAAGDFFFMKRTPSGAPPWLELCRVEHGSGNVIDFPMVDDLAALLWIVNLGCIDLNQWYATCDDVNRPDYLHFDLDPVKDPKQGATSFAVVREAALELKLARAAQQLLGQVKAARKAHPRGQRQDERTRTAGHVQRKVAELWLHKLQFLSQHFRSVAYRKLCEGVCRLGELLLNGNFV